MVGGTVTGGFVTGGSVVGGTVTGGFVTGGSVVGGTVTGGSVTGGGVVTSGIEPSGALTRAYSGSISRVTVLSPASPAIRLGPCVRVVILYSRYATFTISG